MNRRQLAFVLILNAIVSLVVALAVAWFFETRRPDLEELAAIYTPRPEAVLAATAPGGLPTPAPAVAAETSTPTPADAAAATPADADAEPPAEEVYVVQPGDTLLAIATRYGITVDDILRANNLNNPDFVFAGQRLVIPVLGSAARAAPTAATEPEIQGVQIAAVLNAGDLINEAVLVVNESDTPFNLQGWRVQREGGVGYTFAGDTPLFPGGSVRVHSAAGANTSVDVYWGLTEPVWQSGVNAQLVNDQGNVVGVYRIP
jgi:LysM repeat protein